jgi:TRAP-type mannitol/chloroaromatic compound transport system permease large subunit
VNVILLLLGTFMDMAPLIVITTPIFLPILTPLGIDPVHFGIIMMLNLGIGLVTPPVGSVLFVAGGRRSGPRRIPSLSSLCSERGGEDDLALLRRPTRSTGK